MTRGRDMSERCSRWIGYCTALLVASLCLTGCSAPPTPSGGTVVVATPTPLPSAVPPPSPKPLTYTLTPSPTVLPTFTPCPTLTVEEREALPSRVRELLKTNGGCELPCWWGITLGQSGWPADPFVACLAVRGSFAFDTPHPTQPFDYYIDITFNRRDRIIQSIKISSGKFNRMGKASSQFYRDWARYSLDQVLTRYGKPSQVLLELWPNPPEPYYPYRLFVFYEELGILIAYEGPAIPGETFRVCPEFEQVTDLRLWLQSPNQEYSFLQLANLDPTEQAQLLPIEEATGMDVETFYKTFKEAYTTVCLESPAEVWP